MTEPARFPGNDPAAPPAANPGAAPPDEARWARPDADQAGSSAAPGHPRPTPPWGAESSGGPAPASSPWGTDPSGGPAPASSPWGASSSGGPTPGWGPAAPAPMPPPPREAARPPKRVEPVAGTPFAVVHLDVPPVTSGLAVGSLVAGIVSTLVSVLVICLGAAGGVGGAWAAGAFTVLGVLAGTGAVVAGLLALRQIRRPAPPPAVRFTGRGLALAGVACGGAGLLLSLLGLGLALLLTLG